MEDSEKTFLHFFGGKKSILEEKSDVLIIILTDIDYISSCSNFKDVKETHLSFHFCCQFRSRNKSGLHV